MSIQITTDTGSAIVLGTGEAILVGEPPSYIGTLPVFRPPKNPDMGPEIEEKPNLYSVRFGDGYTQDSPKGLNHIDEGAQFTWGLLTQGQRDLILAFFRERGGYRPFWWQPPGDRMVRWKCRTWRRGGHQNSALHYRISAVFERSFDPFN